MRKLEKMGQIGIKAYAKLNLDLKILEKLPNGYHKISSVFQAIDIYDIISISKQQQGFYLTGSVVCPVSENLIKKAKEGLENFIGKELACRIHLVKNIPLESGLGGGSSDAAATLVGLNKIYNLNLSLEKLLEIGLLIGSDVPFFLFNEGNALVGGIGEKIRHADKKPCNFYVLARPHKRISTAGMYALFDKTGKTFFKLACEICQDVKKLYDYFLPVSDACGMSGTGPTIFAEFDSYSKAVEAVENFGYGFNGDFFICKPCKRTYEVL